MLYYLCELKVLNKTFTFIFSLPEKEEKQIIEKSVSEKCILISSRYFLFKNSSICAIQHAPKAMIVLANAGETHIDLFGVVYTLNRKQFLFMY